ncbi:CU044_2847 family protein [[Micrococcus luteus] ATCC 49442]|uniref:CU044_2847 family protein n=1 Tax=[Micrococcus luteus] ATCC 49442 TaxID=2698727 RepID=UPI0013DD4B1A|nr:CU044_2847 family protein [[Micrococcus luteus] ATCC 49442]
MTRLVEFPTANGAAVLVEVKDGAAGPVTRGGAHGEVFARAQQTFENALGNIRPAVQAVIDELLSVSNRPDEVCIEFGLDVHAEVGAFIAAASSTSNFKVTLTWRSGPDRPSAARPAEFGSTE